MYHFPPVLQEDFLTFFFIVLYYGKRQIVFYGFLYMNTEKKVSLKMKKTLLILSLLSGCLLLSALDVRLNNGRVLKDFSGIGNVAPVPRTNLARWGVVVFYQNGAKKIVVEQKDFPRDFPYMTAVRRRLDMIPAAKAKAMADMKEKQKEIKEDEARKKRLQKIAADAAKAKPALPKKGKVAKRKEWKSGSSSND